MKFFAKASLLAVTGSLFLVSPQQAQAEGWNQFSYGNNTLDVHGYFRTSAGAATENGDQLPVFIAPGAQSRYRLGNESDTNIEVSLDYHYYLDQVRAENSRYIQVYGMLSDYEQNPEYARVQLEPIHDKNPQSFIRFGNFLGDGVNAWFGRRYYGRRDIHIIDHFWLNVSQGSEYGGGIEGVPLGVGRLDVATFVNEDRTVADRAGGTATDNLYTHTLDVRYHGIPTNDKGDLTFWGFGAHRPSNGNISYEDRTGFGLGGWHTQQDVLNGRLITGFAYRRGVAMQQGLFSSLAIREPQGYDTGRAWSFEINNDWYAEFPERDMAVQWVSVLRHEDRVVNGVSGSRIDWASTGARPVFFLNDYFSLATEVGVDFVDNEIQDATGLLGKGTVALQLTQKKGFFERPMVRLFATGAVWSDDFRGLVANGNPADAGSYADDTSGVTYGIQFEVWW